MNKKEYTFDDLLQIMVKLRAQDGCPWDREQTHESLKPYLIEETYEVIDALEKGQSHHVAEELGDLLLQIVFHAQIGKEEGTFTIDDVVNGICSKMVSRHTHIFGDDQADTADDVVDLWEKAKQKEKGDRSVTLTMEEIPRHLPALMRSGKVQKKAAKVGFDWDHVSDAFAKVKEEVQELEEVYLHQDKDKIEDELGDVLFAAVNVARFLDIEPEEALTRTINKFVKRFDYVEQTSLEQGKNLKDMTLAEMDALWDQAKEKFRKEKTESE